MIKIKFQPKFKLKKFTSGVVSLLLALALNLTTFFLPVSAAPLPDPYLNELYANGVYYYNPCGGSTYGGAAGSGDNNYIGHFDPSLILSATNADKQYGELKNHDNDPVGDWSDKSTEDMKDLLTSLGDLAYQVGRTVNIPWVGVLVQLRYEDGRSPANKLCGKNNLWGIRCIGGKNGKNFSNMGEAFVGYAECIMNGYHDQALGITDPKEFLEKLGPTWVHGDINSSGYGAIEGMKNSVDALQKFIDSPAGQDIVKNFHGYSGSSGGSSSGSAAINSADYIDSDGWFKEDSISGLKKESALTKKWKSRLRESPSAIFDNGTGKPTAILLHYTAGGPQDGTSGLKLYGDNLFPAHFTIDLVEKKAYQHFPLTRPSLATKYADQYTIQFEIVGWGYNARPGDKYDLASFGDEEWDYLAKFLIPISAYTGIPLTSDLDWEEPSTNASWTVPNFKKSKLNLSGVIGHMHVQDDKIDPGNIWPQVKAAIERAGGGLGGTDACGNSLSAVGSVAALQETVLKYAWPNYRDSPHPKPAYAEIVSKYKSKGQWVGANGIDCGGWVTILMRESGWDPNYNSSNGNTSVQKRYLDNPSHGWVKIYPKNAKDLLPGDVNVDLVGSAHHTWAFVGDIPGFDSQIASASQGTRAPCAGHESMHRGQWYRKVK